MMRSKGIILGLCFSHFFLLMSIALVAVEAEDQPVSETNHQKNNSSPVITENINNTLPLNVSTTAVPSLPSQPNDTSPISPINKDQNTPDIIQGGKLGKVATAQDLKSKVKEDNLEDTKRSGWVGDWLKCKFVDCSSNDDDDDDEDDEAGAGVIQPKTDSRSDFKKPVLLSKHEIGPLEMSL